MRLAASLLTCLMICVAFVGCEPKVSGTKAVTDSAPPTTEAKVQRPTDPPTTGR